MVTKQALGGLGTAIGAIGGGLTAPKGNTMEGVGRGGALGFGVDAGSTMGTVAGLLAAGVPAALLQQAGMLSPDQAAMGTNLGGLAGMVGGGAGGYGLAKSVIGDPTYAKPEKEKKKEKEAMDANIPTVTQIKQAEEFLQVQVAAPVFFDKLAALGVEPKTQAEALQLSHLGDILYAKAAAGQYKTAAELDAARPNSFLEYAMQQLNGAPVVSDQQVKVAAAQYVSETPEALTAALLYGYALAGGETAPETAS